MILVDRVSGDPPIRGRKERVGEGKRAGPTPGIGHFFLCPHFVGSEERRHVLWEIPC